MGVCPKTENACLFRWAWVSKAFSLILLKAFFSWLLDANPQRAKIMLVIFLFCLYSRKLLFFTLSPIVISVSVGHASAKIDGILKLYCGIFSQANWDSTRAVQQFTFGIVHLSCWLDPWCTTLGRDISIDNCSFWI